MWKRYLVIIAVLNTMTWQACEKEVVPGPVDCSVNPVIINVESVTNSSCGLMDGKVQLSASGGSGDYNYTLGTGQSQSAALFEGLAAGVYEVSVSDKNNCSATTEVTVTNVDGMNISFAATNAGGCSSSNGTLTVTAFDGTEPYQYKLGEGSYSANHVFTDLAAGLHELFVSDATGCEVTQSVRIPSGISFSASIAPIIEANCAISDCHNGSQHPDFRAFKNIKDNAADIKALTGDGTMPQEGSLTQAQIDMIACWVDDGAPAN